MDRLADDRDRFFYDALCEAHGLPALTEWQLIAMGAVAAPAPWRIEPILMTPAHQEVLDRVVELRERLTNLMIYGTTHPENYGDPVKHREGFNGPWPDGSLVRGRRP